MEKEQYKPEMFLVINARIPVLERIEGEELYRQLREMLKNYSEKIMLFGQINETLEPCCERKVQSGDTTNHHNTNPNRSNVHT